MPSGGSVHIPLRETALADSGRAGQHGCDDGQQAGVFLQSGGVGKKPIHGQGADGLIVGPDGGTQMKETASLRRLRDLVRLRKSGSSDTLEMTMGRPVRITRAGDALLPPHSVRAPVLRH